MEVCSLSTDEEILDYIQLRKPEIVSIDSPLGLPGGGNTIDPRAGIVRVAEHDLASIGIPAYPALIDSMQKLTLRGIRLRTAIQRFSHPPRVIESYPGAAQDILCIPRKQKSLDLLREGLMRLGLKGSGLATRSHDEMDAVTSALVGRYFEAGQFEPMGIPSEAQLIVPKVSPIEFELNPVICLAGKTGAGKSVVARYQSVFYGFDWLRTRRVLEQLLLEDVEAPADEKLFHQHVEAGAISEQDLQDFGAVVLNTHNQAPLRLRLAQIIGACEVPVVVDAIRDSVDVDTSSVPDRAVMIWSIDCNDSIIQQRGNTRKKEGQQRMPGGSPVDRTAGALSVRADVRIPNNGSLEELRWRIDDVLFASITLASHK